MPLELEMMINQCVTLLKKDLDRGNLNIEELNQLEFERSRLKSCLFKMSMFLAKFNFYPGAESVNCCSVAFFCSLTGNRWTLDETEVLTFEQMFKNLIKHCQGACPDITKFAVIIADNWDDDVVSFWKPNIERLKSKGISILVYMMIGPSNAVVSL
jgi:hypothetical protein